MKRKLTRAIRELRGVLLLARGDGRLKCNRCGWCCQNQLVSMSTTEIQAIMAYLKQQNNEAIKIYTCATLAYDRNIDLYETGTRQGLKRLQSSFDIGEVESFENDKFLAKNHILHFSPDTQRCVFLDPLSSNCLIYPARPLTCRMFPYDVKDSAIFMVNETDECPGVGHGERVNIQRLHRLSKMCEKLLCIDELLFREFVQCEGLRKTDLSADYAESINIIDPFVQLGLIPSLR